MKNNNIFWISYSDLMTSLFFVMLVLFVVTIGYLNYNLKTTEEQLQKIQELQTAVQELPKDYFEYQAQYKRFKLNKQIQFDIGSSKIRPEYYNYLLKVGNSILTLINELKNQDKFQKFDIKYLVVIEGMASKDSYSRNYELSYERALSLYRLWKVNGITFDANDCEIQISGSGTEGIREYSGSLEDKNQQFLIHILPKMGRIGEPLKHEIEEDVTMKVVEYIKSQLKERPELIPANSEINDHYFFTNISVVTKDSLVFASFEDGHYSGSAKYKYTINKNGIVSFQLLSN